MIYNVIFPVNVLLSLDETYADVTPVRLNENAVSAYVYVHNTLIFNFVGFNYYPVSK